MGPKMCRAHCAVTLQCLPQPLAGRSHRRPKHPAPKPSISVSLSLPPRARFPAVTGASLPPAAAPVDRQATPSLRRIGTAHGLPAVFMVLPQRPSILCLPSVLALILFQSLSQWDSPQFFVLKAQGGKRRCAGLPPGAQKHRHLRGAASGRPIRIISAVELAAKSIGAPSTTAQTQWRGVCFMS